MHGPTILERWPSDADYILYVDESGTEPSPARLVRNSNDLLILAAAAFSKAEHQKFQKILTDIKARYWPPSGFWTYRGPSKRVVLHGKNIRHREGPFAAHVLSDAAYQELLLDLERVARELDYRVFGVVLNLVHLVPALTSQEGWLVKPYHLGFRWILNAFVQMLRTTKAQGVVVVESRLEHLDAELWHDSKAYLATHRMADQRIVDVHVAHKWDASGSRSYGGLEFADLCADTIRGEVVTRSGPPVLDRRSLKWGRTLMRIPSPDHEEKERRG
jgi:hypothetical protein